jgi:hypothetical protein
VFVEFWVLLEMGLQLGDFSEGLLAGVNWTLQFLAVDWQILVVLLLDLEDVHQDHDLFFFLHVL